MTDDLVIHLMASHLSRYPAFQFISCAAILTWKQEFSCLPTRYLLLCLLVIHISFKAYAKSNFFIYILFLLNSLCVVALGRNFSTVTRRGGMPSFSRRKPLPLPFILIPLRVCSPVFLFLFVNVKDEGQTCKPQVKIFLLLEKGASTRDGNASAILMLYNHRSFFFQITNVDSYERL